MTTRRTSWALALILIAAFALLHAHARAQNDAAKESGTAKSTPASDSTTKAGAATTPATGHEGHTMPSDSKSKGPRDMGTPMTITGEVMDPACFLEAGPKSIGTGHYQCAIDCALSGQTLAIYDREKDRIYFIAGELPGKNPNDPLMAYIHKKVNVTGVVFHRSEAYGIKINKVELYQEKKSSAQR
jgi:hypothetical protein